MDLAVSEAVAAIQAIDASGDMATLRSDLVAALRAPIEADATIVAAFPTCFTGGVGDAAPSRGGATSEGTVAWYDARKGFGTIAHSGIEIFVHHSGIKDANKVLLPGQVVQFDPAPTSRGLMAINVVRV